MAFDWDALCKARRDFAKPKNALAQIKKLLKKKGTDPYVQAWRAEVLLSTEGNAFEIQSILLGICEHQPPVTDRFLLSYVYRLLLETSRRFDQKKLTLSSVGSAPLKVWQDAAKHLSNRVARLELWSALFVCAMREDCWEDVRFAILQANKEGPKAKKVIYYTLILVTQLAAEKKIEIVSGIDPSIQIQLSVAERQMRDAYDNTPRLPDDAIRVRDIRDLRFMAELYRRQGRLETLFDLWDHPPSSLKEILEKHHTDLELLKVKLAEESKNWSLLESCCWSALKKFTHGAQESPEFFVMSMSTAFDIWRGYAEAVIQIGPMQEATKKIKSMLGYFSHEGMSPGGRAMELTVMLLASRCGDPLLRCCKDYWTRFQSKRQCYNDLRRLVMQLSTVEQRAFHSFAMESTASLKPTSTTDSERSVVKWFGAALNLLKFEYTVIVEAFTDPTWDVTLEFVCNAVKLYRIGSRLPGDDYYDAAYLAVLGLLQLHSLRPVPPHYLLQAAMFTRRLFGDEAGKQNRPLALLSARLHLNLGLGTVAFRQYSYAKVKEMLHDSVAWLVLSRISQTHPFGAHGPNGFSAEAELLKVVDTIERMEDKVNDFLYTDLQEFKYDTACELVKLKEQLQFSLTRQHCEIELRRIARLKGEPADRPSNVSWKNYEQTRDNSDPSIIPGCEYEDGYFVQKLVMLNEPVSPSWIDYWYGRRESCMRFAHEEQFSRLFNDVLREKYQEPKDVREQKIGRTERMLRVLWDTLHQISLDVFGLLHPQGQPTYKTLGQHLTAFLDELNVHILVIKGDPFYERTEESFRTALKILVQDDLEYWYGLLEAALAASRLMNKLQAISRDAEPRQKAKFPRDLVVAAKKTAEEGYTMVCKLAQNYIEVTKSRGVKIMSQLVREDKSGSALASVLSDTDVQLYAKEYMESQLVALNGVLKVKLK